MLCSNDRLAIAQALGAPLDRERLEQKRAKRISVAAPFSVSIESPQNTFNAWRSGRSAGWVGSWTCFERESKRSRSRGIETAVVLVRRRDPFLLTLCKRTVRNGMVQGDAA